MNERLLPDGLQANPVVTDSLARVAWPVTALSFLALGPFQLARGLRQLLFVVLVFVFGGGGGGGSVSGPCRSRKTPHFDES